MKRLALGFLGGFLAGALIVGFYFHRAKERDIASVAFGNNLYAAQSAAKTLSMLDQDRLDIVRRLQLIQLESSVDASYRMMVTYDPQLGILAPNLRDGLADAVDYLGQHSPDSRTYRWLQEVSAYVERASEHYATAG